MSELSNYLDIALGVVKEGASIFTKNISKYNQLEKNIGREVKIRGDKELNKIRVRELNKLTSSKKLIGQMPKCLKSYHT